MKNKWFKIVRAIMDFILLISIVLTIVISGICWWTQHSMIPALFPGIVATISLIIETLLDEIDIKTRE